VEPDLTGFVEAQEDKRRAFGDDISFFFKTTAWPTGVPTDEEGVPLDPTVRPLLSEESMVRATAEVAHRPVAGGARGMKAPSETQPIGNLEQSTLVLILSDAEWTEKELETAFECEVYGRRYVIRDAVPDQMGPGAVQRRLVFVEKK
jgi:hypothetical protein